MAHNLRVAIIGGGIGGLTAANALMEFGLNVDVYDQADVLSEVGAGIQLGPNGVRVLHALGLKEDLARFAYQSDDMISIDWKTAALRFRQPLASRAGERFGAPYLLAHRHDFYQSLLRRFPAGRLHTSQRCTGVATDGHAASATFAGGEQIEADVIVGADGVRSIVRECLFGKDTPRYTGQSCFRTMLPMDQVPDAIGPDRISLKRDYTGWIGPNGHVILYPIRAGQVLNMFVGFVSADWAEESWTVPTSTEEMLSVYAGWHPALLDLLRRAETGFKWGLFDRDPLERWSKGRITLLGDAAHPMMPTLAQGACQAIEDGWSLARHLKKHIDNPGVALEAYEAERAPRASRVQLQARQQFLNNKKVPPPEPLSRDWIFSWDATTGRNWMPANVAR
jgi:salicylate hydroxylase